MVSRATSPLTRRVSLVKLSWHCVMPSSRATPFFHAPGAIGAVHAGDLEGVFGH
jgi:hypothetical protein